MRLLLIVLLGSLLAGCAASQGFDRDAIRTMLPSHSPLHESVDAASPPSGTLATPFRLALYFMDNTFPPHGNFFTADWVSEDHALVDHWFSPLQEEQILAGTLVLAESLRDQSDDRRIHRTAARYGADVVLIVEGAGAVDRYHNKYAAFYPTLLGAYVAPGTQTDALFLVYGRLWDLRSDQLWESLTVEGQAQTVGPAMFVQDRQVLTEAKKAALQAFGEQLAARLRQLTSQPDRTR